ncbi:BgTH12-02692 [Blumeria graminis f. sp. triticale]|uniref:Bgt-2510 n=3 Tax=Blumeria graminis TaxID=34373 RepID=A0A381LDT8_BLUGR|nr:Subunit of the SAGA transcriptional regulatory complex [Blumeria graminis f. sp. tritici 96224]CAD6503021.1 BgTH12-02692 [Blumeria graminis f. sp. triticale]VDB88959.1 Bgt-2510 [Blumeria graminis f. sp. tritici]
MIQSATLPSIDDKDEQQRKLFKKLYLITESKIDELFGGARQVERDLSPSDQILANQTTTGIENDTKSSREEQPKKSRRVIDEDNYDDDDEEEEDESIQHCLSKDESANDVDSSLKMGPSAISGDLSKVIKPSKEFEQPKSSEHVRKQLELEKKAIEETAKRSFHTLFFTLENDRIAMLEQQQLEESEKQIDAEMDHSSASNNNNINGENHGSLSNTNLGASSLTLKHLIARIDLKRDQVRASDAELRSLMNEVRKNRSKWASEENVHQEELYEAAEKVLSELKAMTEYSAPFLTRVNKRDAPDYYNSINSIPLINSILTEL